MEKRKIAEKNNDKRWITKLKHKVDYAKVVALYGTREVAMNPGSSIALGVTLTSAALLVPPVAAMGGIICLYLTVLGGTIGMAEGIAFMKLTEEESDLDLEKTKHCSSR